jgi:hypothetical protein
MAVRLEIKRQDGTTYWVETFRTRPDGDRWLAEERTRPYWNNAFIATFIDEPEPTPIARDVIRETAIRNAITRLAAADTTNLATVAQVRAIIVDLLIALGIR